MYDMYCFTCMWHTNTSVGDSAAEGGAGGAEVEVVTLLATADYGVLMQDSFPLEPPLDALLGIQVPKLFLTAAAAPADAGSDAEAKADAKVRWLSIGC
jgi:hypothetical protein